MDEALTDSSPDEMATFTVEHAITTLLKAVGDAELSPDDLRLLRAPADNAVIAIPNRGLVARVAVSTAHRDRLARELAVADWLAERHIRAIEPAAPAPTPQLVIVDGRVISWWTYLPTTQRGSYSDLGLLLRALHHQPPPWPTLPALDPWARVPHQISAAIGLPVADRQTLHRHWQQLRHRWDASRWPHEPGVVVHGDAYPGNTLYWQTETYLLDFEDACIGPPAWDVASVLGAATVGWIDADVYAQFCNRYGADLRTEPEIDLLVDIVLFRRTCWYASRTGREPAVIPVVRHRIATLADPSLPKRWLPG